MPSLSPRIARTLKAVLQAAALAAVFLPVAASAQSVFNGAGLGAGLAAAQGSIAGVATGTLDIVVEGAIGRAAAFSGLAAFVVITLAGFYLILGLGNDDSRDKAKKIILYTAIGLGVVFFAAGIVNIMQYIIGQDGADPGIDETVRGILGRVVAFVGLIATVVIVIAGFYLILGLGDESSKDKAKKIILYTIVGIIIIGIASVIVGTIFFLIGAPGGNGTAIRDVAKEFVIKVLNFLALIAVITVIIAGIYLIISLGNDENKDRAKKIIMYTLAGLLVILFSRVIVGFVTNIVSEAAAWHILTPSGIIA